MCCLPRHTEFRGVANAATNGNNKPKNTMNPEITPTPTPVKRQKRVKTVKTRTPRTVDPAVAAIKAKAAAELQAHRLSKKSGARLEKIKNQVKNITDTDVLNLIAYLTDSRTVIV